MIDETERILPVLHPDDAQLVLREQAIPGLPLLLDDDVADALFRQHLKHFDPTSAHCEYLRYKPGMNCLAAFEVGTHRGSIKVHVIAHRVDAADKLAKAHSHSLRGNSNASHRVVVPESALIISVFPCDDELQVLDRLYSCEGSRSFLSRLAPDHHALHSGTLTTLRYKPQRRYVARLDVDGTPAAVLKLHTEAGYVQARRAAKSLGTLVGVSSARPLGHSDRHAALLLPWLPGISLGSLLKTQDITPCVLEEAGRVVAILHSHSTSKLPRRTPNRDAQELTAIASDFQSLCPVLAKDMNDLADRCVKHLASLPQTVVPIHGDLHLQQILIEGLDISLIDLDNAALGNPASDVGNFFAHLEREFLFGQIDREFYKQVVRDFLRGYFQDGRRLDERSIGVYTVASLLRLAQEPFRTRQPNWREKSETLITRAGEFLVQIDDDGRTRSRQPRNSAEISVDDPFGIDQDEKLPLAAEAIDPNLAQRHLLPVVQQAYQDDSLALRSIRTVRHKRGRRCLVEYTFESQRFGTETTVLGKIHAKKKHQRSFRLHQELWKSGFDYNSEDGVSIPRPIAVVDQWHMWLQEHVAGQNGWDALSGPNSTAVAVLIADAAHKLQRANILTDRVHTIEDELQLLEDKLPQVARTMPRYASRIGEVLKACQALAMTIPESPQLGIHRDYYPDQVIVDHGRIYILDHDLYCVGNTSLDIGNFCGHLIERAIRDKGHSENASSLQQTIIDRFAKVSRHDCFHCIDAFITLTLARHIYLSTLFAGRRSSTTSIINACEERLNACRL